jgi:hypothetical protein
MVLNVRTDVDPLTLQIPITNAIRSVNKDQAIADIRSLDQIKSATMGGRRIPSVLLGVFGAVALILAGIGIYGVISYSVAQRTREIGIRVALGASERSLLRLVLDRGVVLTALASRSVWLRRFGLTRLMASLLFGVGARDPMTMRASRSSWRAVALLASYVPRATGHEGRPNRRASLRDNVLRPHYNALMRLLIQGPVCIHRGRSDVRTSLCRHVFAAWSDVTGAALPDSHVVLAAWPRDKRPRRIPAPDVDSSSTRLSPARISSSSPGLGSRRRRAPSSSNR